MKFHLLKYAATLLLEKAWGLVMSTSATKKKPRRHLKTRTTKS